MMTSFCDQEFPRLVTSQDLHKPTAANKINKMAFNDCLTRWQCSRLLRDVRHPFSKNTGRGTNFPVHKPQVGDNTSKSPTHVYDGNSNIFFPKIISYRNDSYPHPSQQASSESPTEYLHYLHPPKPITSIFAEIIQILSQLTEQQIIRKQTEE